MTKKTLMIAAALGAALGAAFSAFAEGGREPPPPIPPAPAQSLGEDALPGAKGGPALAPRSGGWEDIDGLSSASILRVNRSTFGYVDRNGMDGYRIKLVDVGAPEKVLREKLVGGTGRNVAMWAAGPRGRIILVEADELGRQDYTGYHIVVYDQDLRLLWRFPYGNQAALADAHRARPLNHREPLLALTDQYAIAGWQDKGPAEGEPVPNFISVYSLADGKAGHIPISADTAGLDIGNLTGLAAQGGYIIAGGSAGTRVLKIDPSGPRITAPVVEAAGRQTPGSHWIQDNRSYVLESVEGNGTVRVWKWNNGAPPSLVGVVSAEAETGSVQALSFDHDAPDQAYLLGKVAGVNAGSVYRINLAEARGEKLFTIPDSQGVLTGMWTIQVERSGGDRYYIAGGTVGAPPNDMNGVIVLKNPPTDGGLVTAAHLSSTLLDFPTPARSMKAFKSGDRIFYAVKNHMSRNYPAFSRYMLRLMAANAP